MTYNISRIEKYTSIKGRYFFDTMIWLELLNSNPKRDNRRLLRYVYFFERVRRERAAQIVMSPLLMSEITNRHLRDVSMPLYMDEEKVTIESKDFKSRYRPTDHYKDQRAIIMDELEIYINEDSILADALPPNWSEDIKDYPKLDFNDYIFYRNCKENKITIVTDDVDFFVEDVNILTFNNNLIDKLHRNLIK